MKYLQTILILLVSLIHFYFLYLEMFLWTTKKGIKTFGLKNEAFAQETKILAANQGLYNGFLASGLVWSIIINNNNISLFFLICVIIAGVYGAYSTKKIRIFYFQSVPAIISIFSILFI